MNGTNLQDLALRMRQGDVAAKAAFRQRLEPQLARIVSRVLEKGTATSGLERKILAAAERLAASDPRASQGGGRVARNLCQMVVSRLWPGMTEAALAASLSA